LNIFLQADFILESALGYNVRRFLGDALVTLYPYADKYDTTKKVLYVSVFINGRCSQLTSGAKDNITASFLKIGKLGKLECTAICT
jgi:hypothetical protein